MRHLIVAALASLGILGSVATSPAGAQLPPARPAALPSANPVLSPYLNLLRGGLPAVNYYGLVRPQQQYNTAINSLEQQVATDRAAQAAAQNLGVPATGHPIYFMNYQRYFLNTGAVSPFQSLPGTAGVGAAAAAAAPASSAGLRAASSLTYGATSGFRRY